MGQDWRISVYDLRLEGREVVLPAGPDRFIYALEGQASVEAGGGATALATDAGVFAAGEARVSGTGMAWIYEVGRHDRPLLCAPEISVILSRRFALPDAPQRLLRADRIESQSGAATPRHGHRGPGLRRLIKGRLLAEIGDNYERIDAGHPWFETGTDPVIGTNIHSGNSAFVRVMVLPAELEGGKSSFVPTTPEDAAKPRSVINRLFGEQMIPGEPA